MKGEDSLCESFKVNRVKVTRSNVKIHCVKASGSIGQRSPGERWEAT